MKHRIFLAFLLTFGMLSAQAHGPTPKKIDEQVIITVPPDQVWKILGDFGGMAQWHPSVARSTASDGNNVGSERVLEINGEQLTESLDEYDAHEHSYSYRLMDENVKALPVSSYFASIQVQPEGDGSVVTWIGRFYRGDTGNFPSEELDDEAAIHAMTTFFHDGLANLKKKAEGQ
uniref:SRPBCC family protein n=1 Tax=Castellaniella defragrans TaxID=75697 RepID=UPI00333E1CE5